MFYKLFVFILWDCDESPDDGLPIVFTSKAQVESKEHKDIGSYRYLLLSLISLFVAIEENSVKQNYPTLYISVKHWMFFWVFSKKSNREVKGFTKRFYMTICTGVFY